jgi:hypothetical protein
LSCSLFANSSIAYAACKHPPIPWRFGQQVSTTWRTDGKSVCTSTSNHPEHIERIEIESKPQHGIAGKNGPLGVAYKPDSGFHGLDNFVFAVTSNSTYRKGPGMIARVTVLVIVE